MATMGTKPAAALPGTPMSTRILTVVLVVAAFLSTSCGRQPSPAAGVNPGAALTLSVAASTREIMESQAAAFVKTHPAVTLRINPGPSGGLANQIIERAPVDLFLSASSAWADKVGQAGLAAKRVDLLTNSLVIVVPKGNPLGIKTPADLSKASVERIALAGENVPAGQYAGQALTKLELLETLKAAGKIVRGQDVRSALAYVQRGEADAGIVYSTDVNAATEVEIAHTLDSKLHDEIVYTLVLLREGAAKPEGVEFFEFLQAREAEAVYTAAGFRRLLRPAPSSAPPPRPSE
jgi:molybdate transport system substrate-binding protein